MNIAKLSRTTTFRLTLIYSIFFTMCVIMLMGFVYWKTAREMTSRVDQILILEEQDFTRTPSDLLLGKIGESIRRDQRHIYFYGLFSSDGKKIAGNVADIPQDLPRNGRIYQTRLTSSVPPPLVARAAVIRLDSGALLLLGHDVQQLAEFREIMKSAFFWGGFLTVALGLVFGLVLSFRPLSRIEQIQRVCELIMRGDIRQRLPISIRRDELDMLTAIVNKTLDEIERLMSEVKSVCDNIAHDLRTPLTRLRALIYRAQQQADVPDAMLEPVISEMDSLLLRFRALLRISEIENKQRQAGFGKVNLSDILEQAVVFFEPLAEDKSIGLSMSAEKLAPIQGDGELLFEAITNLLDNAIKFTPSGGKVMARLSWSSGGARIDIVDTGSGIEASERAAVLNRFYRGANSRCTPGFGLGLSIVAAIVRLHDFEFELGEADSGTRATIFCRPSTLRRFVE
ncbi:MAG: sensor histidine kinase [Burkholderiales bacterium]